jgi:hypothetical protein
MNYGDGDEQSLVSNLIVTEMTNKRFLLLLLLLFWIRPVRAQTAVAVTLTADQNKQLTVGDPIQLTLQVDHPAGTTAILPQLPAQWGDFAVRSQAAATTAVHDDGSQTTTQIIDVRLFSPGEFQTPPFTVTISDSSGQTEEVAADPLTITITSVLVEGDTNLRDIRPQADLPVPLLWPWMAGGVLLLAALAYWLWWRRRTAVLLAPILDTRLPHEVALDELAHIAGLDLPAQRRFKEHYTLISDCLRGYVEKVYHVAALESTTVELRRGLKQTSLPPDLVQGLLDILNESDLVKFAKLTPDLQSATAVITQATVFVLATKPVKVIPPPALANFSSNGDQTTEVTA